MNHLKSRLLKLEIAAAPLPFTGVFRTINDGGLTLDQEQQIAEAKAAGKFVIIREIVRPVGPTRG